jgi:predicted nucleotidyltransferase
VSKVLSAKKGVHTFMDIKGIKKLIKQHKDVLQKEYGVEKIGIFGSYMKNEATETSDLDILVDIARPAGFFKFIKLEIYLSDLTRKKVDLVTRKSLKPAIGKRIMQEIEYV